MTHDPFDHRGNLARSTADRHGPIVGLPDGRRWPGGVAVFVLMAVAAIVAVWAAWAS